MKKTILLLVAAIALCASTALGGMIIRGSGGATPACIGYSNNSTNCEASLDGAYSYYLGGADTTVCRYWSASTSGTITGITYSLNEYTSSTAVAVAWYKGTARQGYKVDSSPGAGENFVDLTSGATGSFGFSSSDNVYYCISVDNLTGRIERDEGVSQPPANYHYYTGYYLPDPISLSENTTRELCLRLHYEY